MEHAFALFVFSVVVSYTVYAARDVVQFLATTIRRSHR